MTTAAEAAPRPLVPLFKAAVKARLRRWMRPPRRLEFTREGKYFVGITIGVGFAAINTGNNLLYLLLGMMLSLIIASGLLSEMSLRELSVARMPPDSLWAERPFLMGIGLSNQKQRFASFSVEVEDLVDGEPLEKKCYFLKVPQKRTQSTSYRYTLPRRGRYTFSGFRLSTKFPFSLFRKSRIIDSATQVIVYPALRPVPPPPEQRAVYSGDEAPLPRGRRGEFHGLREFRQGDDPRDIHWRSSARRGRRMVREHDDEASRRVALFLEHVRPTRDDAGALLVEDAISLCASLVVDYLERGWVVRLVTRAGQVSWAQGRDTQARFLELLALLPVLDETRPWSGEPDGGIAPHYIVPGQKA
ncbi:MAG: DUF58 domain-containing protein [Polyangia bacterium]